MNHEKYSSRSRGQVDVDAIVAYLIFLFFIIFLINFLLRLVTPFSDSSEFELREKKITSIVSFLEKYSMTSEEFQSLCTKEFDFVSNLSLEYNLLGFTLPQNANYTLGSDFGEGQVRFIINGYDFNISAGRTTGSGNASFDLVFPKNVYVSSTNSGIESEDDISNSTDFFNNQVFSFNLSLSAGDEDTIIFVTSHSQKYLVVLTNTNTNQGMDLSKFYVGDLKMNDSCGTTGTGYQDYVYQEFFTNVVENNNKYLSKVKVNAWII
ncbi:MAG: hypothetical protein GOU97_02310 [Nanoarchaeota archaeon]|nr:hypothetical protein [Nanoarchaeota archaeon]